MMTLGSAIVLGGWAYAVSARLVEHGTELGIKKGRSVAWICTALGILVDFYVLYAGV